MRLIGNKLLLYADVVYLKVFIRQPFFFTHPRITAIVLTPEETPFVCTCFYYILFRDEIISYHLFQSLKLPCVSVRIDKQFNTIVICLQHKFRDCPNITATEII